MAETATQNEETTNSVPSDITSDLSGDQKAAVLLISLGVEKAAKILKRLHDHEVERLSISIAKMEDVESDVVEAVRNEYYELMETNPFMVEGGSWYARDLLTESLGEKKAEEVLERHDYERKTDAFKLFQSAEIEHIVHFLKKEQPQVAAVILAQIKVEKAAKVLMALPDDIQSDVAFRLANMGKISTEVVEELEDIIKDEMSTDSGELEDALTGTSAVASILNESSIATERIVLEGIDEVDAEMADEIKEQMFLFEDILELDDRTLQSIISNLEKDDLVMGLKGVSDGLEQKFINNMSKRAADILNDDIEALGPVRVKQVEDAQKNIIRLIKELEENGEITIRKGSSDKLVE